MEAQGIPLHTHIFTDSCTNGDSNRESTKKDTCKHSIKRKEKEGFKKEPERYCGYSPERVHSSITWSLDESFFFYMIHLYGKKYG